MEAAFRGQCSVCKWLVKRENARVDFSDSEGKTPLILAACGGHADVCEFLLTYHQSLSTAADTGGGVEARPGGGGGEVGGGEGLPPGRADPEARDGSGWTALMWAVALDHYPCMQVLLDNGADYKEIGLPYPGTSKYNAGLSLLPLSAGIYKVEARAEGERRKMGERERIRKEVEARRRRWEEERAAKARKEREDEEAYRKGIWRRVLTRR
uniref:Uncharacterized protein n=1 Tax=Heterosigma akashiwo TaxID=2829 RepID=A0A7S4DDZ2_HETAK